MFRDITIGQYYNGNSIIHKLDPRVKLVFTLLYSIALFLCNNPYMIVTATVVLILYIGLSKVPITFILRGLRIVWIFIAFTALFSLFNGSGDVLIQMWKLKITTGSVNTTIKIVIRLVYLILGASVMSYTTLPIRLAGGLERLLSFLKIFRVPVAELAMILSIALRFIPIFMEELDKIMKAQLSRGADFESGNIAKRIKSYVPVFIPLFASAVSRAGNLANAMDARCFNGSENRSRMNPLKYGYLDVFAYLFTFAYFVAMIWIRVVMK